MALGLALEDPRRATNAQSMLEVLRIKAVERPAVLLDVVDYWLSHEASADPAPIEALQELLSQSRSVWQVQMQPPFGLTRRIAPEAQAAADTLMRAGRPGEHLSRAWRAAYGRAPNPSDSYRQSVKAVEVAAIPVVIPRNTRGTLGTVITALRDDPTKWHVSLHSPTPDEQVPSVRGMLELLWKGQSDRHGTPDSNTPLDVTQADAEAALHLALTLVQWFTAGVVKAR
jgi:hypothetical protein